MNLLDEKGFINDPYRNYIAVSKYARWIPEANRREVWSETVDRYVGFMKDHMDTNYPNAIPAEFWPEAREAILNHEVMPSMRILMTAGPALARNHLAAYNCSAVAVNSPRIFDESLYVLMNGVGLGFSVEKKYVDQLPIVNEHFEQTRTLIRVADSKEGWARALRELIAMLYVGQIPEIDVTEVRPAGARLKTFGGTASGPGPLVSLFDFVIEKFKKSAGRKLTPLECHDIMCKIGEVIVSGGVRRSALISLSDLDDYEISKAKTGAWWEKNSQRRLANNSSVYNKKPSVGVFMQEWLSLYDSKAGERGIINMENLKSNEFCPRRDASKVDLVNPCGEIRLRHAQLCNLSEVIIKEHDTKETLEGKVKIATILGTMQSSLTKFKYLRKIWRENCEEERLLGVSKTGQFGNKLMSGQEGLDQLASVLDELQRQSIMINAKYAQAMGINQSVAIGTVKPSGTVSQLTNSSSGMHPWHNDYYIRSVRQDNNDPVTKFMKAAGIPNEPDVFAPDTTTVFYFPIAAPADAITRTDISAVDHLEFWKVYKEHWTEHNPSITVSVKDHEWIEVANWVYENWAVVGGISFLPYSDHTYQQAPYQDTDESGYRQFAADFPAHVDWSSLVDYEREDTTTGMQELSCVAGACDIVGLDVR